MEQKKKHPAPISIAEQIENLKNLDLVIEDEEEAAAFLKEVSYFRLVKAFSIGLKPKNGRYDGTTTFRDLTQLYLFNSSLRQLLFPLIEKIEVSLRCRLANHFSCKYGVLGYEHAENFANPIFHARFLREIEMEIQRNAKTPFVRNFQEKYENGKIPFYALVELFSFGTLSKFYKNMKGEDKKAIAHELDIGYTYLESWIESIAFLRNICAHYGRLYYAKLTIAPKLYKEYVGKGIQNNKLFAVLLCMKHIFMAGNFDCWNDFVESMWNLIADYSVVKISAMGFPEDWKEILLL